MAVFYRYGVFSLPLLLVLAALHVSFSGEPEVHVYFKAYRAAHPVLTSVFKAVTDWVNPLFYVLYGSLFLMGAMRGDRRLIRLGLAYLVVELVVSLFLVRMVKMGIGRPRPDAGAAFMPFTTEPSHHSLPSGHTTEAVVSSMPFALRSGGLGMALLMGLVAAAVGFSRVYLGWHHPTDVFFAWMLGSAGGLAVHLFAGERT